MTTPYHIKLTPSAKRQILHLNDKYQKLLLKLIDALAVNPRPPGANRIEGMTGLYAQVMQHHRLIYKIEEHDVIIVLIK